MQEPPGPSSSGGGPVLYPVLYDQDGTILSNPPESYMSSPTPTPIVIPPIKASPTLRNTVIHVLTVVVAVCGTFSVIAASVPKTSIPGQWLAVGAGIVVVVSTAAVGLLKVLNG